MKRRNQFVILQDAMALAQDGQIPLTCKEFCERAATLIPEEDAAEVTAQTIRGILNDAGLKWRRVRVEPGQGKHYLANKVRELQDQVEDLAARLERLEDELGIPR